MHQTMLEGKADDRTMLMHMILQCTTETCIILTLGAAAAGGQPPGVLPLGIKSKMMFRAQFQFITKHEHVVHSLPGH